MKHEEIFGRLDPPPGGLARLRARMDTRASIRRRRATASFGLAIAAVVALFFFIRSRGALDVVAAARGHVDTPEVSLGLARMPAAAVAIEADDRATTALTEVRTSDPNVSFYWVSSTAWRE